MKLYFNKKSHKITNENTFFASIISALITYLVTSAGTRICIAEWIICRVGSKALTCCGMTKNHIWSMLSNVAHCVGNLIDVTVFVFLVYLIVMWIITIIENIIYPKLSRKTVNNMVDEFWNEIFNSIIEVTKQEKVYSDNRIYSATDISHYEINVINSNIRVHKEVLRRLKYEHFFETYVGKNKAYETYASKIDIELVTDIIDNVAKSIYSIKEILKNNPTLKHQYMDYESIYEDYKYLITVLKNKNG